MSQQDQLSHGLVGRYRIERELGQGGMATVYLAHDLKHDRTVAIKVLHPELAHALGPERFMREITITAQLDHPYILSLLDSGVVEPGPGTQGPRLLFYVMPYIEGESLRDRLKQQKQLPLEDALQVTREIAEALGYAHSRRVIHRDIKPENILLSGGHARVADFGIAKALDDAGGDRLTQTGLSIGTPAYMSPEQSAGEGNLDARSDLYSLGCVLYEMLAGSPPFQGPSAQAVMARHAVDPVPSLRTVRATVPVSVEAAITKALAKVPADRFTSAAQFVAAFSQPAPTLVVPTRLQPIRGRRGMPGAAIALALAILGGWSFVRSRRPPVQASASVIAVLPFGTNGDSALIRLSHDLVLTVSASLDGVGGIRTTDPQKVLSEADDSRSGQWLPNAIALGKQLGASSVVVGSMVPLGSTVQLDLKLVSTKGDSEPLARFTVTNSPDSISALTDSITWALLRQVWRRGEPPSPSYANLTTRSVLSLRAFLDGERLSQAGNWSAAADAYAAAIKADSSFWLASWAYNNTQGWLYDGKGEEVLARGYESHLSAFGERDRLLIEAGLKLGSETEADALARLRAITERFPSDWVAWFKYADVFYHIGPVLGHSNSEVRAALQRTVELNPKLVPMWDHLFNASVGQDSAQAARAMRSLAALGKFRSDSAEWGFDATLFPRLYLAGGGTHLATLLDSLAAGVAGTKVWLVAVGSNYGLHASGFPIAQVELNRRLLALNPHGPYAGNAWEGMSSAWAARGAWDSALVATDRFAALSAEASPVGNYRFAVAGAWLGGLQPADATARRAAAVTYLNRLLPADSAKQKTSRAAVAWADGMLAVLQRDQQALKAARVAVQQSGSERARYLDRSLAGFELELEGAAGPAGDSLAALDMTATDAELGVSDRYAISLNHLSASRLLLARGDTSRAVSLLAWHEADMGVFPNKVSFQVFAPLAYYELARIEEAQGRNDQARADYRQFLRRYDMPPPAHQHLVAEARAALKRLAGEDDAPATR